MIDLHLTTVRKYRSKHEWRPVGKAYCTLPDGTYLEEIGDHALIVAICAKIEGLSLSDDVRVLRDGKPCFLPLHSSVWAKGGLKAEQPAHLRKIVDKQTRGD